MEKSPKKVRLTLSLESWKVEKIGATVLRMELESHVNMLANETIQPEIEKPEKVCNTSYSIILPARKGIIQRCAANNTRSVVNLTEDEAIFERRNS